MAAHLRCYETQEDYGIQSSPRAPVERGSARFLPASRNADEHTGAGSCTLQAGRMGKRNSYRGTLPDFLQNADTDEEVYVILPTTEEENAALAPLTENAHTTLGKKAASNGLHALRSRAKIVLLIISGALGAAIWYWGFSADTDSQFQVALVTRGDLTKVVTATGQLNPRVTVQVSSQI